MNCSHFQQGEGDSAQVRTRHQISILISCIYCLSQQQGLNEHPNPSLLSAEQLQLRLDASVGFLQAALKHMFAVFTPSFLCPDITQLSLLSRHNFASRGVSLGQMITRSGGNHAASLALVRTET